MSTVVTTKPRRVPPPCWTQDEAQSLILAYRDRWFSLGRANLKAADWDHVAAGSSSSPPKTALQCRHKMEKLRKRYRSEKQRAARCPPGRFFSSWALFPLMDEMESDPDPKSDDGGGEFGVRVSLKARDLVNVDRSFSPGVDQSEVYQNSMEQFRFKTKVDENSRFYSDYVNQGGFPLKTRSNLCFNPHGGYGVGIRSDGDYVPGGSLKRNVDFRELGGYAGLSGSKFVKKSGNFGVKRDVGPVEELATSIKQLGEGFARMEKMKMEMTMEIEKRRMEMELKRHEVMMETQQQVLDAFVDALSERKKKKKAKVEAFRA